MVWLSCGLLWCFYQLFGLSFWRHPFTAEDPLLSKWWNAKFLQICSDEDTSWRAWGSNSSLLSVKKIYFYVNLTHNDKTLSTASWLRGFQCNVKSLPNLLILSCCTSLHQTVSQWAFCNAWTFSFHILHYFIHPHVGKNGLHYNLPRFSIMLCNFCCFVLTQCDAIALHILCSL